VPFPLQLCTPVVAEGVPSLDFCVGVERHPVYLWMRLRRSPEKGDDHVTLLKLDAKMSRRERTVAQEAARRPGRLIESDAKWMYQALKGVGEWERKKKRQEKLR